MSIGRKPKVRCADIFVHSATLRVVKDVEPFRAELHVHAMPAGTLPRTKDELSKSVAWTSALLE
jgi:hypothetical protein